MLKKSESCSINYLTKVIKLNGVRKHLDPKVERLQCVTVDGFNVITGIDAKDGDLYIYFPAESALNAEYLSWSNSFENKEMNADKEKKGFFNKHGRVRNIKLRGERSEGYIVPVADLATWLTEKTGNKITFTEADVDTEFDYFDDVKISEKYVNRSALKQPGAPGSKNQKKVARQSKLVDGQFRFHIDTSHLSKNMHNIDPNDLISITNKLHGTSFIVSRILCKKPLNWLERLLKRFGLPIIDTHYDMVYSSRKVIKNQYNDHSNSKHYYNEDIWGEISKTLEPLVSEGITMYGEAVGYTRGGGYIQAAKNGLGYDYGCAPGEYKTFIYRITLTNVGGKVFEFSAKQVKDYCAKLGLNYVPEFYYGYAKDLFDLSLENHWQENFLQKLSETYLEKDCDICVNKVPGEGIVLRKETLDIDVYKHKSFRFKAQESEMLDSGEVDLETQESETVPEEGVTFVS